MSETPKIFKRYEMKYLVTDEQREAIVDLIGSYMKTDEFGKSTINNIYFDTPTNLIARRSIERPLYKEKLRLRSYGLANPDSDAYLELKKKYDGVVYKRRVGMKYNDALDYICKHAEANTQGQILSEIDYFLNYYKGIQPAVCISYDRIAYYGTENRNLRLTFDENILWRSEDLRLDIEPYGNPLLKSGENLMEIKVSDAIPIWLVKKLDELNIYKCNFSKYGMAYKEKCVLTSCPTHCADTAQRKERRPNCA